MIGAVVIIVVLVAVIPVAVLLSAGVASALLGGLLNERSAADHEGSELADCNI